MDWDLCTKPSLASFPCYTGTVWEWGYSPVSHSWVTSRGTHSQMRGLHCAHTQWALHQNWCHSRPHSWLQTTEEDALKVKKSRMSELPKSTSHLINASTCLVPRSHLRERVWGRNYVSTVLSFKMGDTIWRLMLVERLLYFLSCQSSVFNFSTQTLSHVQAINTSFLRGREKEA